MADATELTTVFRSADPTAEADATEVRGRLAEAGLSAVLVTDQTPGVVVGTYEVRVPPGEAEQAETIIATLSAGPEESGAPGDASHDMDLAVVFSAAGTDAEMLATAVESILKASDIPAVMVGSSTLPSLSFEVQVPQLRLAEARQILDEARAAGPEAAEEAEAAGESPA